MKIEIIKDGKGSYKGYTLEGETEEEKYLINAIRNMNFFLDVKYDGREGGDDKFAGKLKWKVIETKS